MNKFYQNKMEELGYNQLVCDIFVNWENVKDEILLPERKQGSGNGTIHIFLGAADNELRQEFSSYYDAVENGEDPAEGAIEIKHYFTPNNIVSMVGHLCKYLHENNVELNNPISTLLSTLVKTNDEGGLISTKSLFKLSTGSNRLRPYFKQFESTGIFSKIIRQVLIPNSAYKISLLKNEEGEYAAFWLVGFADMRNFEAEPNTEKFINRSKHTQAESSVLASKLLSYLTAIRTKPFLLLAGISGTGKSRIVRKLAQATDTIDKFKDDTERFKCHSPQNFCLIQVKPNWHNSMDVVGFKSNIGKDGEHYEYTPFVEFIAKAWHYPDVPFFLCLDEMNLAPVEEYFAEFLSAIESRSINDKGEYETDPIIKPFDDFGMEVCGGMIRHLVIDELDTNCKLENQFRKKGLTLPKNLIVMGTVNMDETTFSFSRKVLDRAMSIEMNEVDYDAFLEGRTEDDIPVLTDRNALLVDRKIKALDVKDDIDAEGVKKYLSDVNDILEGTPFKLGYRAANEAMLYVAASKAFGNNNLAQSMDDFTLMKILSRIEGDDSKLKTKDGKELLDELMSFFKGDGGLIGTLTTSQSIDKLVLMQKALERDHFVSFWG